MSTTNLLETVNGPQPDSFTAIKFNPSSLSKPVVIFALLAGSEINEFDGKAKLMLQLR